MRFLALAGTLALTGLAACSSGSGTRDAFETGVGFGNYQTYLRDRAAQSQGASYGGVPYSVPPETPRGRAITPPSSMPDQAPRTIDAVPARTLPPPPQPQPLPVAQAQPQPIPLPDVQARPGPAPVQAQVLPPAPVAMAGTPAPLAPPAQARAPAGQPLTALATPPAFGTTPSVTSGGPAPRRISDEQDFTAVAARETIESDRERLARQRAQYQVIEVTSVPGAEVSGGPNLVAYALSQQHPPGTEMFRRINPLRWSSWQDNCLRFRTQEAAQEAFLASGGPERDRDNLDPDGDGYACWWDPTPLRQAVARN